MESRPLQSRYRAPGAQQSGYERLSRPAEKAEWVTVTGEIDITTASLGAFSADDAELNGGDQRALWAQGAKITGDIWLERATVTGEIDINGSTTSYLTVAAATLTASNAALSATQAVVRHLR